MLKKAWRRTHNVVTIAWIYSSGFLPALCPSLDSWGQCQQPQREAREVAQGSDQLFQFMPC